MIQWYTQKKDTYTHKMSKNIKYPLLAYTLLSTSMKLISFYTLNNPASYSLFPLISNTDKTKNLRI